MTKRAAGLLPAVALALLLAGCGSEEPSGSSDSGSSSGSSSEPAEPEATGEDYVALVTALFEQQGPVQGSKNAEQFNQKADLPEGISMAELDKKSQSLCLEDTNNDIALAFSSRQVVLQSGACADGEEVATIIPSGDNDAKIEGDAELAQPVVDYLKRTLGF